MRDAQGKGQQTAFILNQDIYISPKMFKSLHMKIAKPKHDKNKSDAFSLGLVLIEAGILKSIQGIYDRRRGEINQNELHNLIEEFSKKYFGDYALVQAVRSMLVVSEFDRTSFTELKMQYANQVNLKDLAKSDDFEEFNFIDRRTSEVSQSRTHNMMKPALGTNIAYNPIAQDHFNKRYGTNYMNFDDGSEDLSYWNNTSNGRNSQDQNYNISPPSNKSNPLTGGLLNHGGSKGNYRKPLDGMNMNKRASYFTKKTPESDVRNPLSDYNGFSNRRKNNFVQRETGVQYNKNYNY